MFLDPHSWTWALYLHGGWDLALRVLGSLAIAVGMLVVTVKRRRWILIAVASVVSVLAFIVVCALPITLHIEHIQAVSGSMSFRREALGFRADRGRYPATLQELCSFLRGAPTVPAVCRTDGRDAWGRPLLYTTRPDGYLVVSLGRDGKAQRKDYWALRDEGQRVKDCSLDADLVASDRGVHVGCGK